MPLKAVAKDSSAEDFGFKPEGEDDFGFKEEKNPSEVRAARYKDSVGAPMNNRNTFTDEPGLRGAGLSSTTMRSGGAALLDALGGSSDAVTRNAADVLTGGNLQYSPENAKELSNSRALYPKSSFGGKVAGTAGIMSAAAALPATIATPVLAGGAQGFIEKPAGDEFNLPERLQNAKNSAIIAGLLQGGAAAGGKAGDWLMQKAVGAREYIPGLGTKIADEGLIGTKGMMEGQVDDALPEARAVTNSAAAAMPGRFSPYESAKSVSDYIKSKLPTANLPAESMPQNVEEAREGAKRLWGIVGRPDMTGAEALDASRKIGTQAYREGDPMAGIKATLNRIDAGSIKGQLKNASEAVKSGLAREATLETAKNSLSAPATMADYARMAGKGAGAMGALGAAGYAADGKEGAATGMALGALGSTSVAKSVAGQALTKAMQANPAITAAILDSIARKKREAQK